MAKFNFSSAYSSSDYGNWWGSDPETVFMWETDEMLLRQAEFWCRVQVSPDILYKLVSLTDHGSGGTLAQIG